MQNYLMTHELAYVVFKVLAAIGILAILTAIFISICLVLFRRQHRRVW